MITGTGKSQFEIIHARGDHEPDRRNGPHKSRAEPAHRPSAPPGPAGTVALVEARLPFMLLVLRDAARLYVRFLPVILVLAVVLFGITDVLDYVTEQWSEHIEAVRPESLQAIEIGPFVFTSVVAAALLVLAEPLFAGLVDKTLHPAIEGARPLPLRRALVEFPYGRAIGTELLYLLAIIAGFLLLVVPGMAAYTLLGLAVPLVVAEDLRPTAALRRSFALLVRNLGVAILLVLLPAAVSLSLDSLLDDLVHGLPWWAGILADVAFSATVPAYAGVVLAVLAVWLPRRARAG